MANIDWDSLSEKLKNGSLKEHFVSTFASSKAEEAYAQHCKYFLSEYKISSTILPQPSVSVSILRVFFTSVPNYVLNDLRIEAELFDYIQSILSNEALKSALKGSVLSVLTILVRKVPNTIPLLQKVNHSFNFVVNNLVAMLSQPDLNTDVYLGAVIILHQLEELLNALGSDKITFSLDAKDSLTDAARVLKIVSTLNTQKVANTTRIQVDAIKLCGMLSEIWVSSHKNFSSSAISEQSVDALCSMPQSLFTIITTGDVTHDCFHSAYHGAVQVLYLLKASAGGETAATRWGEALVDCVRHVTTGGDLLDVVDCARVEIVVGFMSCFYDAETLQLRESPTDVCVHTDVAVQSIVALQSRMKTTLQSAQYAQTPRETQKDIKSMFSDIRKGSIASAAMLLGSNPQWVVANQTAYWDLCLKSLASPVLFTVGHKALPHDEAFTTRMLTFLQSALKGIARYSVSAADDIILTLQDLVDSSGADCNQLYSSDDSHSYNIPQSLLDAFDLCPKTATTSSQSEAQLNWQVAVVVTLNSLIQQSARLHSGVSEQQNKISLSFLSGVLTRLTAEVMSLTQNDSSSSKKSRRGGNAADLRVELLQSLTVALTSTVELIKVFTSEQRHGDLKISRGLRHLGAHLMQHVARPIVFEDDRVQVCSELDLLVRVVALFAPRDEDSSMGGLFVTVVVVALSNMLLTRNGCEVSLVVDLSRSLSSLDAAEFSISNLEVSVSEVREELRCLHASSLSDSDQQRLRLDGDVIYEATREALLSLAHHLCKNGVAASGEEESRILQRIYDALPLEVNQQPALDTSGMSSDACKLELKSSFVLDLLSNIRELLDFR